MSSEPPSPPTLAMLESVLPEYGKFSFDRTLEAARNDIGTLTNLTSPIPSTRSGCVYG
jgi:hypothetical protein